LFEIIIHKKRLLLNLELEIYTTMPMVIREAVIKVPQALTLW
jgi:hypothetical protein